MDKMSTSIKTQPTTEVIVGRAFMFIFSSLKTITFKDIESRKLGTVPLVNGLKMKGLGVQVDLCSVESSHV